MTTTQISHVKPNTVLCVSKADLESFLSRVCVFRGTDPPQPRKHNGPDPPLIVKIKQVVADYYGITVDQLMAPTRVDWVAWPRQVAMALTRELTDLSLNGIGETFGGKDHGTVLHAAKQVTRRCEAYAKDRVSLEILRKTLTEKS